MRTRANRRAIGTPSRLFGVFIVCLIGLSAAGCAGPGQSDGLLANARGGTVAFESIDGPPREVFRKLVANLTQEAEARSVPVVSREGTASYRVRGYLSAQVERDKTSIAWVLDIYDGSQRRALRVSGEEPVSQNAEPGTRAGRQQQQDARTQSAWSLADDAVLRRIARSGMERIAGFLNGSEPPPEVAPPQEPAGTAMAAARDNSSPEAAGILRTASVGQ